MQYKRIMIFGSPGSGKSTLGLRLSKKLGLPLYHNDKYFYTHNWIERDIQEFFDISCALTKQDAYIMDGNCMRMMLERNVPDVDMMIYLDVPRLKCLYRVLKRYVFNMIFGKNKELQDRAPGCDEQLSWHFLSHNLWTYKKRQEPRIELVRAKYPHIIFMHIDTVEKLQKLENMLVS